MVNCSKQNWIEYLLYNNLDDYPMDNLIEFISNIDNIRDKYINKYH